MDVSQQRFEVSMASGYGGSFISNAKTWVMKDPPVDCLQEDGLYIQRRVFGLCCKTDRRTYIYRWMGK